MVDFLKVHQKNPYRPCLFNPSCRDSCFQVSGVDQHGMAARWPMLDEETLWLLTAFQPPALSFASSFSESTRRDFSFALGQMFLSRAHYWILSERELPATRPLYLLNVFTIKQNVKASVTIRIDLSQSQGSEGSKVRMLFTLISLRAFWEIFFSTPLSLY